MNKGIEIRKKKLAKNNRRARILKEDQKNIVRFVEIKCQVIEKADGKYNHNGNNVICGLQIQNKVYLADGHYKFANNKNVKILKIYDDIPEWVNGYLKEKFFSSLHSE